MEVDHVNKGTNEQSIALISHTGCITSRLTTVNASGICKEILRRLDLEMKPTIESSYRYKAFTKEMSVNIEATIETKGSYFSWKWAPQ